MQQTVGALCADTHPGAYSGQDAYTGRLIPQIVGSIDCRIGAQRAQNAQAGHMLPMFYDMKQHHNPQQTETVQLTTNNCATVRGDTPLVQPIAFPANLSGTQCASAENIAPSMGAKNPTAVAQPVHCVDMGGNKGLNGGGILKELSQPLGTNESHAIQQAMAVRRLTPIECERLQGFPDNYSNIPWRKAAESPDGPRYKALGNSWAVPVVAWIGQRIQDQIK